MARKILFRNVTTKFTPICLFSGCENRSPNLHTPAPVSACLCHVNSPCLDCRFISIYMDQFQIYTQANADKVIPMLYHQNMFFQGLHKLCIMQINRYVMTDFSVLREVGVTTHFYTEYRKVLVGTENSLYVLNEFVIFEFYCTNVEYLQHIVPLNVNPAIQSHTVPLHTALSSIHVLTTLVHISVTRVPSGIFNYNFFFFKYIIRQFSSEANEMLLLFLSITKILKYDNSQYLSWMNKTCNVYIYSISIVNI